MSHWRWNTLPETIATHWRQTGWEKKTWTHWNNIAFRFKLPIWPDFFFCSLTNGTIWYIGNLVMANKPQDVFDTKFTSILHYSYGLSNLRSHKLFRVVLILLGVSYHSTLNQSLSPISSLLCSICVTIQQQESTREMAQWRIEGTHPIRDNSSNHIRVTRCARDEFVTRRN